MPLDMSWVRDTGPVFLVDGQGGLAGVDWRFNGWGDKFPGYDPARDAAVARQILEQGDARVYEARVSIGRFDDDQEKADQLLKEFDRQLKIFGSKRALASEND